MIKTLSGLFGLFGSDVAGIIESFLDAYDIVHNFQIKLYWSNQYYHNTHRLKRYVNSCLGRLSKGHCKDLVALNAQLLTLDLILEPYIFVDVHKFKDKPDRFGYGMYTFKMYNTTLSLLDTLIELVRTLIKDTNIGNKPRLQQVLRQLEDFEE